VEPSVFDVTVCANATVDEGLRHDLELVKMAVLYGGHATLISVEASVALPFIRVLLQDDPVAILTTYLDWASREGAIPELKRGIDEALMQ
jgi:hypothetical protein